MTLSGYVPVTRPMPGPPSTDHTPRPVETIYLAGYAPALREILTTYLAWMYGPGHLRRDRYQLHRAARLVAGYANCTAADIAIGRIEGAALIVPVGSSREYTARDPGAPWAK